MKIINKIALTDLTNFGSKARKDIRPNVLIGEKKAFKKGDILDANAIELLVDVMVRNGGSTEELEGVLQEIQDNIVSLEEKIDNIIGNAGTGFSSRLTDIEEQLADMDYHTIDELLQLASDDLRSVITKMQTCCGNVQLTVNELKALVTSRDQEIQQLVSDLDQKLTQYLEMVIDGQVIILGPSEIIQGDSFTYFTVGITSRGLEVLDNYDGVFSIISEVPTYNAGTEENPDIRPVVTISDHGVLNTVDANLPTFTVQVKIEYDFGEDDVATSVSEVLVKNLGAPSIDDMEIVGYTDDPQFAEKPYQLSTMGNTFTLRYIGGDSESINWDNIYFTWRVTGNVTGTYIDGNQEEQHYIEVVEYASDHIIIRNLVGQGSFKSGEIIVECYTRNSDRFLFDLHYGIELYDPEVLMSINSNYEVFTALAAAGIVPEHNGQRDYLTYREAATTTLNRLFGIFNKRSDQNKINIKHFDEFQYFGINASTRYYALGEYMFYGQSELESITIPPYIKAIGGGASSYDAYITQSTGLVFKGCKNLKEIRLPYNETITYPYNGTTLTINYNSQLQAIGYESFAGCTSLYKIYGGQGLQWVHSTAFKDCLLFYDHWNEIDPETGEYVVLFEPQHFVMKAIVNDSPTTTLKFVDTSGYYLIVNTKSTNVFAYKNNWTGAENRNIVSNGGGMLFSTGLPYIPMHTDNRPANGVEAPLLPSFAIDRINPETGEPETVFIRRDIFGIFYEALTTKPRIKYTYYTYDDAYEEEDGTIVQGKEYKHYRELNIDDLDYHITNHNSYFNNYKMVNTYVDLVQDNMIKFSKTNTTVEFINPPQGYSTRVINCMMNDTWSDTYDTAAGSPNFMESESSGRNYTLAYYKDIYMFVRTNDGNYYTFGTLYISKNAGSTDMDNISHIVIVLGDKVIAIPKERQDVTSSVNITNEDDITSNLFTITRDGLQMEVIDIVLSTSDNGSNYTSTYIWDYLNPQAFTTDGDKNTYIAMQNDQNVVFPWAEIIAGWRISSGKQYYLPSFGECITLQQANVGVDKLQSILDVYYNYSFMSSLLRYDSKYYDIYTRRLGSKVLVQEPKSSGDNAILFLSLEKISDSANYILSNGIIPTEESKLFKYGYTYKRADKANKINAILLPDTCTIPNYKTQYLYNISAVWDNTEKLLPIISMDSSSKVFFCGKENGNNYDILCVSYPTGDIKYASISKSNFNTSTNKLTAFGISAGVSPTLYGNSLGVDCDNKTLAEIQESIENDSNWSDTTPNLSFTYGRYNRYLNYLFTADFINTNYG